MKRQARNKQRIAAALKGKNLTRTEPKDPPPLHEEEFSRICAGCGQRIYIQKEGCVTRYTKSTGLERLHRFGCEPFLAGEE